jgi:DNA-binding response OmpR family regulator
MGMRILVTGDDDDTRRHLAVTLQGAGHAVRMAQDERGAVAALQQEVPHLVLVTTARAGSSAVSLVRQLRDNPRCKQSQLVLVAKEMPEPFSVDAYGAGLDGDIRIPHSPEYLLARVNAIQRRFDPKAKPSGEKVEAAKPAAPDLGDGPLALVARASAWRTASQHIKTAASKFLTLDATVGDVPPADYAMSLACGITLLNVQHELELRIAVGTNQASGKHLAVHLFGPEGEDLVPDMLGEIGNIFMGAMKTALGHDSLAFTGGLPEVIATEVVLRPTLTYKLQEAFSLTLVDAKLVVHLGLRSKANLDLPAANLKEGMVLSKDVFNSKGLMMINAGTRLSGHMIEKLKTVLNAKQVVQVMAA